MKSRYSVCLLLIVAASAATEVPGNPVDSVEAQNPIEIEQKQSASSPSSQSGGDSQQKPSSEPLQRFEPRERIPAGSAISFPTDI